MPTVIGLTKKNLIATFISPINLDVHVSTKNTLRIYKGVCREQKKFLKIKQNGGFSFIFSFLFGRAP